MNSHYVVACCQIAHELSCCGKFILLFGIDFNQPVSTKSNTSVSNPIKISLFLFKGANLNLMANPCYHNNRKTNYINPKSNTQSSPNSVLELQYLKYTPPQCYLDLYIGIHIRCHSFLWQLIAIESMANGTHKSIIKKSPHKLKSGPL